MTEREIAVLADKLKPYIVPWIPRQQSGGGSGGGALTHDLVGAYHKATGLTTGNVLKALSPTSFGFGVVQWSEINKSGSSLADLTTKTHSLLSGLASDDHAQYVHNSTARSITAQHTFAPSSAQAPFLLSANAQGQTVVGLRADQLNRTVTAGAGLSGAGALTADITVSMGTPSTLTVSTANSASGTTHSHAITSNSAPGEAASILASNSSGQLTLPLFVASNSVTTPALTSSAGLAITSASGDISLDASTDIISIGASNLLKSANYASQSTGWGISYAGGGDFRYLFADEMHVKSFIADLEQALAGGQIISKSVAMLYSNFTAPAAGGTATLTVRDLPSATGMAVFPNGDFIGIGVKSRSGGSLTVSSCWGTVVLDTTYGSSGFDSATKTQRYTFTRSSGTIGAGNAPGGMAAGTVVQADAIILDYGVSGNGYYEVNAVDGAYGANSPYWRIVSWTTHPNTGKVENARGGKLTGIFGTANEYGVAAGTGFSASDAYVRYSNVTAEQNNVASTWRAGGTALITISPTYGISLQSYDATGSPIIYGDQRVIEWASSLPSVNPDGAIWTQYTSTQNELYVEARQTGSRAGAIRLIAYGEAVAGNYSDNALVTLAGAESSATRSYLKVRADDVEIDLGNGSANIGNLTLYSKQLLLSDGSSSDDGSATAPAYSFLNDTNTGLFRPSADTLALSLGGNRRFDFNSDGSSFFTGKIESGQAVVADHIGQALYRYGTSSAISMAATAWGYADHIGFNAYLADRSISYEASGAWKYVGAQYTGNVTAPGRITWDSNANNFRFAIGEAGLSSGSDITTWTNVLSFSKTALDWRGNTDNVASVGRAKIGYDGTNSDNAAFAHYDHMSSTNAAVRQNAAGAAVLNSASGQRTLFRINNSGVGSVGTTGLRIGDDAAASYPLEAFINSSVSTSDIIASIERKISTTPAAGMGASIRFGLESSTTENRDAGRLGWRWDVATDASRAASGFLSANYTTTERVVIEWAANSSGGLLGLYGANPVAKQTLTGSRSGGTALTNLIAVLATLGVLIDSTTA